MLGLVRNLGCWGGAQFALGITGYWLENLSLILLEQGANRGLVNPSVAGLWLPNR